MSKKQKQGKTRQIFNRITLTIVLGLFLLLLATMALTTAIMPFIASWWSVSEDNVIVFGVTILAVSIVIGVGFSFAYSAFMLKATKPYLEALQKIADCDFSVRIKDSVLFSGFGVAENFNEMANRLESVETLRDDFVSNFSHEFKTPIASISGFATLLKNPNLSQKDREEYLNVIIDESNRLVSLAESVLLLSRLDSQPIVKENFLLDEQLRRCMLLFEKSCNVKKIELTADLQEISLCSERKLLSQVWVNLLSNAVKFTPSGGKVEVSARKQDGTITVSVKDSGCGMDEETLKNIFSKFYQGDKSHATEGNGLGLAVVRKICLLLNLQIEVHSQPNQGSVFIVKMDATA